MTKDFPSRNVHRPMSSKVRKVLTYKNDILTMLQCFKSNDFPNNEWKSVKMKQNWKHWEWKHVTTCCETLHYLTEVILSWTSRSVINCDIIGQLINTCCKLKVILFQFVIGFLVETRIFEANKYLTAHDLLGNKICKRKI